MVWNHSKDGKYKVKSGYKVAKALKENDSNSSASSSTDDGLWKWLWALTIPNKVKVFLWKCVYGILPTKGALRRRGFEICVVCSMCSLAEKSNEHAIQDCGWDEFYWVVSPLRMALPPPQQQGSIGDWVVRITHKGDQDGHALFAMLLWGAWCAWNDFTFEKRATNHQHYLHMATTHLQEHLQASNAKGKSISDRKLQEQWIPQILIGSK